MIQVKKSTECSVDWKMPIREAALLSLPPWAAQGAYLAVRGLPGAGSGAGPSSETPGGGRSGRGLAGQAGRVLGLGRGPPSLGRGLGPGSWAARYRLQLWQHQGQWPCPHRSVISLLPAGWRGPCPGLPSGGAGLCAGGGVVVVCVPPSPAPFLGWKFPSPAPCSGPGWGRCLRPGAQVRVC